MLRIYSVILSVISLISILISCSGTATQYPPVTYGHYLSPEYEDEHFSNSSLDVVTADYKPEYNSGLDSDYVKIMTSFNEAYRKYFPVGIKVFSSITEVGWVFHTSNSDFNNIVEYIIKTKEGKNYYISIGDSLSFYKNKAVQISF